MRCSCTNSTANSCDTPVDLFSQNPDRRPTPFSGRTSQPQVQTLKRLPPYHTSLFNRFNTLKNKMIDVKLYISPYLFTSTIPAAHASASEELIEWK